MGVRSQLLHWKQLKKDKMTPFLLFSVPAALVAAAPERQRQIRAAAGYDNVCESAKQAYSMAKYFNTATSNNLNVVTPICKAATIAFFNAMIKGASNVEANVAAAEAYMPFIQKDPKADPGSACFKSQDYISK